MAKHRSERDVCLYCFGTLNEDRVCLTCGRKEDDKPALPNQLGRRTMLNKRYLIDKAIGEGGFGITYSAWDVTEGRHVAIKEYYPSGYVSRDPRSGAVIINNKKNHAATNRGLKRFIDEAQNLTPHEIKTIITRAGEGTKMVFTGDIQQIDSPYLDAQSNGLAYMIDKMKGQELFAHINLIKGERSQLSEMASNLL